MRRLALAAMLLVAGAARGAQAPAAPSYTELPAGRYSAALGGMLCAVCARSIAAEWAKLPEVEAASVDYEKASGVVTVRLGRTLPVKSLRKALLRAERVANLGTRFELSGLKYIP